MDPNAGMMKLRQAVLNVRQEYFLRQMRKWNRETSAIRWLEVIQSYLLGLHVTSCWTYGISVDLKFRSSPGKSTFC